MTDTTSSKPMWTRCPGCKDRVFNDKLDIGIHRGHCPADLQKRLQNLERRFDELKRDFGNLDDQLAAGPAIDPADVAPWQDDDTTTDLYDDPDNAADVIDAQPYSGLYSPTVDPDITPATVIR